MTADKPTFQQCEAVDISTIIYTRQDALLSSKFVGWLWSILVIIARKVQASYQTLPYHLHRSMWWLSLPTRKF